MAAAFTPGKIHPQVWGLFFFLILCELKKHQKQKIQQSLTKKKNRKLNTSRLLKGSAYANLYVTRVQALNAVKSICGTQRSRTCVLVFVSQQGTALLECLVT